MKQGLPLSRYHRYQNPSESISAVQKKPLRRVVPLSAFECVSFWGIALVGLLSLFFYPLFFNTYAGETLYSVMSLKWSASVPSLLQTHYSGEVLSDFNKAGYDLLHVLQLIFSPLTAWRVFVIGCMVSLAGGVFALARSMSSTGWSLATLGLVGICGVMPYTLYPSEMLGLALLPWILVIWMTRIPLMGIVQAIVFSGVMALGVYVSLPVFFIMLTLLSMIALTESGYLLFRPLGVYTDKGVSNSILHLGTFALCIVPSVFLFTIMAYQSGVSLKVLPELFISMGQNDQSALSVLYTLLDPWGLENALPLTSILLGVLAVLSVGTMARWVVKRQLHKVDLFFLPTILCYAVVFSHITGAAENSLAFGRLFLMVGLLCHGLWVSQVLSPLWIRRLFLVGFVVLSAIPVGYQLRAFERFYTYVTPMNQMIEKLPARSETYIVAPTALLKSPLYREWAVLHSEFMHLMLKNGVAIANLPSASFSAEHRFWHENSPLSSSKDVSLSALVESDDSQKWPRSLVVVGGFEKNDAMQSFINQNYNLIDSIKPLKYEMFILKSAQDSTKSR